MANTCYFELYVRGRKEDIEGFLKEREESGYSSPFHGADFQHFEIQVLPNGPAFPDEICYLVGGECRWSVKCCMMDYDKYHVCKYSKKHNLAIEIYSEEYGVGFEEHYLIVKGDVLISECIDAEEIDLGDYEYEEFVAEFPDANLSEEDYNKGDYIKIGGYDEWSFHRILDNNIWLAVEEG